MGMICQYISCPPQEMYRLTKALHGDPIACVSCVTSTIVAAPIKSQHFKNDDSDGVYSRNYHDS